MIFEVDFVEVVQMILEVDFVEVQTVLGCLGVDHHRKAFLFLDTDLIS